MRARNEEWQDVALRLMSGAHTIVLLLASRGAIRPGFRWEIETIAAAGLADRVVLVLPPPDHDLELYERARQDVCQVLSVLDREDRDPAFFAGVMPATAIVGQVVPNSPWPRWWRTDWTRPRRCGRSGFRRVGDTTYGLALDQALFGNDDSSADVSYPVSPARPTNQSGVARTSGPNAAENPPGLLDPDVSRPWSAVARDILGLALVVRRRTSRTEFWTVAVLGFLVAFVGAGMTTEWADPTGAVPFVYLGVGLVPVGCAMARRLRDVGTSGRRRGGRCSARSRSSGCRSWSSPAAAGAPRSRPGRARPGVTRLGRDQRRRDLLCPRSPASVVPPRRRAPGGDLVIAEPLQDNLPARSPIT